MKRKILSLFLALSMALACTVFTIPASAEEEATVVEFSDNFDTETDTVPDKWSIVKSKDGKSTLTVMEDNGNKFLRYFTGSAGDVEEQRVGMSTNDSLVNIPLSGTQDIVFKYRIRLSDVTYRSSSHLGGSADACIENNYRINWFRDGKIRVNSGTSTTTLDSPLTQTNVWYNITAKINPNTKAIAYTIVDESDNVSYTASGTLGSIESITCVVFSSNNATGHNIDIDDVSVGYYHAPIVRSFTNDFENETVNYAPSAWEDRNNVSTLTVIEEEDGNQFVRVTKAAGKAMPPMVAIKEGNINLPLKEGNNKAVVIEARIRKQAMDDYRSLLMINPPADITGTQYGYNHYTLTYVHSNKSISAVTGFDTTQWLFGKWTTEYTENTWLDYKAIYIPDKGELRHYFNGSHVFTVSKANLPELLTNMDALTALAFTWRDYSTATAGTMDFDDVKIYELSNEPEISVKYTSDKVVNSEIGATVTVREGAGESNGVTKYFHVLALYDKGEDGSLTLADVKMAPFEVSAWRTGTKYQQLTVTDKNKQIIKTFVWKQNGLIPAIEPVSLEEVG